MHMPLSGLFEALTKIKQEGEIDEFDVTRSTLEQVFQAFARFQAARNAEEPTEIVDGVIVRKAKGAASTEAGNQVAPDDVVIANPNDLKNPEIL